MDSIVITGKAVCTPIGSSPLEFHSNLVAGKSAIDYFTRFDTTRIRAHVGGELSSCFDPKIKAKALAPQLSDQKIKKLSSVLKRAAWSTQISALLALEAWIDANLQISGDPLAGVVVAGHNFNEHYSYLNHQAFEKEPDYIDPLYAIHSLDSDHIGTASEMIEAKGPCYSVGGACASGNIALRQACFELNSGSAHRVLVLGPVADYSPLDLQGLAMVGALTSERPQFSPQEMSRPFDKDRDGFIASHGGAAMVLETRKSAKERGAKIYAEIVGVAVNSNSSHLPQTDASQHDALYQTLLAQCPSLREELGLISAHATSTPFGDLTEAQGIEAFFGERIKDIIVQAPKSLLGHTCWSSALVEITALLLQAEYGSWHGTKNLVHLDPKINLRIPVDPFTGRFSLVLKNAFGFAGINSSCLLRLPR